MDHINNYRVYTVFDSYTEDQSLQFTYTEIIVECKV